MAEAYLKKFGGDKFHVESAGLEEGKLNRIVVQAMKEDGIDISQNQTKSVFDLRAEGRRYDYVITVCDAANAERCPVFHGRVTKLAWWFDDPSRFVESADEKFQQLRAVRDEIQAAVQSFVDELK